MRKEMKSFCWRCKSGIDHNRLVEQLNDKCNDKKQPSKVSMLMFYVINAFVFSENNVKRNSPATEFVLRLASSRLNVEQAEDFRATLRHKPSPTFEATSANCEKRRERRDAEEPDTECSAKLGASSSRCCKRIGNKMCKTKQ